MSQALTPLQEAVLSRVKSSTRENPITGADLTRATSITDKPLKKGANMRAVINALRTKGYPVCANDAGYYWPRTAEQVHEFLAQLDGRIASIQRARAGMVEGISTFGIQTAAEVAARPIEQAPEAIEMFADLGSNQQARAPYDEIAHLKPGGGKR